MLSVDVTLTRGELRLAAAFSLVRHAVLQGANGAGKSTLFRAILGIEPCVGRLTLNGRELGGLPPEDRRIGWVPQGAALFPHLSALGNVAFASGNPTSALAALEQVGAAHLAERSAKVLSGGERQRVALARALATKPEALLLDEPLSALDPVARVALRALLATLLPALGVPSLVITHDAADIAAICGTEIAGRVLTMSAGTLREE